MGVHTTRRWAGQEIERRAPVASFLDALSELMEGDERVVVLMGDCATGIGLSNLAAEYPDRITHGGSAEQNLIGMTLGFAAMGRVPIVVTSAMSASLAAARLLLIGAAHAGLHVVVAGYPGGLAGHAGAAAHALTDVAVFAGMPGFRIMVPTDAEETAKALISMIDEPGPGYMRLTDEPLPVINGPDSPFDVGRAIMHRDGQHVGIIACGALVYESLVAGDLLEEQGISARVLAMHTLAPIDAAAIEAAARETGALVVAEEHAPTGGLGGRVAQLVSSIYPVPIEHLHTGGVFAGAAPSPDLREALGLTSGRIVEAAQRVVQRKG